ncbi:methylmalonyl-CoA mutase family protein [Crocinitomicaceae bacterium]|nr:methylmalonyl-CoA mutase family protein [Crocinitomicaceae bacterium]
MNNLFQEFPSVNLAEWKDKIVKDLKGKELSVLDIHDPIENIDFRAFYHKDERTSADLTPGSFPATRGSKTSNNDWSNGALVIVFDEKEANTKALDLLMKGANLLCFAGHKENIDWKKVLNKIQLEYIRTQFVVDGIDEVKQIISIAGSAKNQIAFCFDGLTFDMSSELHDLMKESQTGTYIVNGYGVQRCGANTWQEVAFCLSTGHELLVKLMEAGFSIDEAAAQIHFHVGVGANYFNEIAKFRSLRQLWSKIVAAYNPEHSCSYNCQITALVGHTNKSLRDPYTNLLRQTTETMSAASTVDAIIVLPYDLYAKDGASELSQRMALNISTLLKEESYLHHVIDAPGGSYSVEHLTETIGQKAWEHFQKLDKDGGITSENVQKAFTEDVKKTVSVRMEAYASGSATLIGVNKFPDPNEKPTQWNQVPGYLGMEAFIADTIKKTETV